MSMPYTQTGQAGQKGLAGIPIWGQMLGIFLLGVALSFLWEGATRWPEDMIIPMRAWVSEFFTWLGKRAGISIGDFEYKFRDFTRLLAWILKQPLRWSEWVLYRGFKPQGLDTLIWIAGLSGAGVATAQFLGRKYLPGFAALAAVLSFLVMPLAFGITVFGTYIAAMLGIAAWLFAGLRGLVLFAVVAVYLSLWGSFPLPWVALVIGMGVLGHWVAGPKMALFCAGSFLYLALFGLWVDSMRTLSIVSVSVPIAASIGLGLGIWVTRSKRAAAFITPMFDVMQATPHMAYLVPIVILFGAGQVPAAIATIIFAMPPMARCTILAIQTVPPEITESGQMSGCTPRQLLWKVSLPSGKRILMLGLNQVVMQTLAMVVIASMVGATGLGQKLLFSLQQLRLGAAVEQGLAIVLIAVVLDRLTQAYANKSTDYHLDFQPTLMQKHRHLLIFLGVLIATLLLSLIWKEIAILPKKYTLTTARELDDAVRWFSKNAFPYIQPVRDFLTVSVLIPLKNGFLWVPWTAVMAAIGLLAYRLGGWRVATLCIGLIAAIVLFGFWEPAILTVYLVFSSVIICVLIGVPIGVWASRSDRAARIIMATCDTLQTFPSFIYLIPVIMLLRIGDLSNIVAILAYATVPSIRYTYLGLKRIPEVTIEAAIANGATPLQRLLKVELPVALPEIMLGMNQTILMALAMVAITALIGSDDLGQEIYRALSSADSGRGVLAGLGIAAIGIIADRLIQAWAHERKKILGMA
jgi:glycine betaine/proline transport system permease protein